ncbi:MAG: sigma-54-dependent Fis family transcriptional regulator [Candidatus Latescibacteria bacterium]|nr:sigma-54-dependent Fis family transcriptional regulator [Candidatus Latescibacterota bacterium]MBT4139176.1 sigma-54-dependent Fis family transcriptional regulator [Candidatus Latescibacterota bacterium]MBT5832741.1 sigma-54-dependent Fis family transcriptional regulator [Candidatus Latescibacterota bacterium]
MKRKVLVVDDQRESLIGLATILKMDGHDVQTATDGADGLRLASTFLPDLFLLDVAMPVMDGFEMCRQLKADPTLKDIPVLFITAHFDQENIVEGFRLGGVDYISKPFRKEELCMRVATHLQLRHTVKALQEKNKMLEREIAQKEALSKERDQLSDRMSVMSEMEIKRWGIAGFVGQSTAIKEVLNGIERLQQVGMTTSVLITGESGTGKELVARALHFGSDRTMGAFVPMNCAAISGELAESLLFGHKKGAFTGADRDWGGYFTLADGGTLFLDEIGDMPLDLQAKLLRVLEEGAVLPIGGHKEKVVDVRVVAATNVKLEDAIAQGRFRQDLYFRLAGFPIRVPPLRDRTEDIPLLAQHFVTLLANEMGIPIPDISDAAMTLLVRYAYPGNVRELKNAIERALIESGGNIIESQHLHLGVGAETVTTDISTKGSFDDLPLNMEQAEWVLIQRAMAQTDGNVAKAAQLLGINRMKIHRRLTVEKQNATVS